MASLFEILVQFPVNYYVVTGGLVVSYYHLSNQALDAKQLVQINDDLYFRVFIIILSDYASLGIVTC